MAGHGGRASSVSQMLLHFGLDNGIAVMSLSCRDSYLRTCGPTGGISGFVLKEISREPGHKHLALARLLLNLGLGYIGLYYTIPINVLCLNFFHKKIFLEEKKKKRKSLSDNKNIKYALKQIKSFLIAIIGSC